MATIYLAAPYTERTVQITVARQFEKAGHKVTSRWIFGGEFNKTSHDAAFMDFEDVKNADWLVLRTFPRGTPRRGGGRHFEFGVAYALGKKCVIVGEKEHIFCHLNDVIQVSSYEEAIVHIGGCDEGKRISSKGNGTGGWRQSSFPW